MARLIFDLDGTLIHSAPTIGAAGNALLAELGRPPLEVATIMGFVGKGVRNLVAGMMEASGGIPGGDVAPYLARYRAIYDADPITGTEEYAGVSAGPRKPRSGGSRAGGLHAEAQPVGAAHPARARAYAAGHRLHRRRDAFDVLKPDARMFWHCADQLGEGPAIMIGDSVIDAATARAAGVPFVLHVSGYREASVAEIAPDAAFAVYDELPDIVARLRGSGGAGVSGGRYRPLAQTGSLRPEGARPLAGGLAWFTHAALHRRGEVVRIVPVEAIPPVALEMLTAPRDPICGLDLGRPRLMGVLNVTPDSFSDGGRFLGPEDAVAQGRALVEAGADMLDIGGESTRPGADEVPAEVEAGRVLPVIAALREAGITAPISIDTRKAAVAAAAFAAGADLFNDVSALGHDPASLGRAAAGGWPVCLMHAQGDPRTMQLAPHYDDVLLDVCDFLEARVAAAEAAGIPRARILVDPGIGFGKTVTHNLALVRGLSMLHGLGAAILFGASRKRFIGTIGGAERPEARVPGSIAVALEALRQGAQVIRVHDVAETRQAVALWTALNAEDRD